MAAGKVWLQSQEALGSTPDEWKRLLVDHLLQSMNLKLWARVAHVVDGKAADQKPAYYDLVKFAVQREAEINFDDAKRTRDSTSKPKATSHFCYNSKKSGLSATQAVWMVAPSPEEEPGDDEATPLPSEESDSGEWIHAGRLDSLPGWCRGHCQWPILRWGVWNVWPWVFKHLPGTCKDKEEPAGPQSKGPVQINRDEGDSIGAASLKLKPLIKIEVGGKEEIWVCEAHVPPFPKAILIHPPQISQQGRSMMLCHLNC